MSARRPATEPGPGHLQRVVGLLMVVMAMGVGLSYAPDRPVIGAVSRWAPPPSQLIDFNGQLEHLRDEGPREDPLPVVLLHGAGSSLHTWEGWVLALRGQRRVITLDLPGFGITGPTAAADYRLETDVQFVLKLLDHLGVQRFVIGGNSLGGEIAWRTALAAPQRVAQLVLVDATGYPMPGREMPISVRLAAIPGLSRLSDYLLPRGLLEFSLRYLYGNPDKVTKELADRYQELALREGNRAAIRQRLQQITLGAQADRIAELKLPTLILWGARDRLIKPPHAQRFAHDIAGSRLVVFDGLGHLPQEEDPRQTVVQVKAFLGLK